MKIIKLLETKVLDKPIRWELKQVNILGGGNGEGKTQLLKKIVHNMICDWDTEKDFYYELNKYPHQVIYLHTQDVPMKNLMDIMFHLNTPLNNQMTPLDILLLEVLQKYNENYKNDKMVEVLVRNISNFDVEVLENPSEVIKLSTGEKELIYILASVACTVDDITLMIMDNMGSQLHIDWQQTLIKDMLSINPKMQIIASTHSPSMINGWYSSVKEINELSKEWEPEPDDCEDDD